VSHTHEYAVTRPKASAGRIDLALMLAAGAVIIGLTGVAFWLSYAHLHTVAETNGLGMDPSRAWAWPATLDAFIVSGELMILRAALRRARDWWAYAVTALGSVGSIVLNVAGVPDGSRALVYVVAAVPPSAAMVAFGVLMRQIHQVLNTRTDMGRAGSDMASTETDTAVPNAASALLNSPVTPELAARLITELRAFVPTDDTIDADTGTVEDENDAADTVGLIPSPGARLSDIELDAVVHMLRTETEPPRSFNEMEARFRELGHVASAARLRAAWKRVGGTVEKPAAV
jgi:hypothetical protein